MRLIRTDGERTPPECPSCTSICQLKSSNGALQLLRGQMRERDTEVLYHGLHVFIPGVCVSEIKSFAPTCQPNTRKPSM
jgi:hypothetical protein